MVKLEIIKTSHLSLCLISVLHLWGPDQHGNDNKQLLPSNISYNVDIEFWQKSRTIRSLRHVLECE